MLISLLFYLKKPQIHFNLADIIPLLIKKPASPSNFLALITHLASYLARVPIELGAAFIGTKVVYQEVPNKHPN